MNREENLEPVSDDDRVVFDFTARYQEALRLGRSLPPIDSLPPASRERCKRLLGVVYLLQQKRPSAPPRPVVFPTPNAGELPTIDEAPASDKAPAYPARLSRFEIRGELGQGGMGTVYRAFDPKLNRLVAVKLLRGAQLTEKSRQRFANEGLLLARQSHPNIVQVYESGEAPEGPYLAMEFVDGPNLQQHLNGRPLSPQDAARLVATLADALEYAHGKGVVHRDLKPSNVLMSGDGTPKLSDFGLAAHRDRSQRITATGELVGTPNYLAPETISTPQSALGVPLDIYGLGCILYETLTGRPPFVGATVPSLLMQVQYADPVPPRTIQPTVPANLETICSKCLHKNPEKRYSDACALKEDLRAFLDGRPIQARPAGLFERCAKWARRRPSLAAAWVVAALAMVMLGGVVLDYNFRLQKERDLARSGEKRADTARKEAEERLLDLSETSAMAADAARDYPLAALWSAVAAKRSEGDPDRAERNRQRWRAYTRTSPVPWRAIRVDGEEIPPRELKLHPTGRWLIVMAAFDCQLWDLDGERRLKWFDFDEPIDNAEFSPDGSRIALTTARGAVHLLTFPDGRLLRSWPEKNPIPCLRFTPDGKGLGIVDQEILVWDLKTDAPAYPTTAMPCPAGVFRFSAGRSSILVQGRDEKLRLYDFAEGEAPRLSFGPVDQGVAMHHVPCEQLMGLSGDTLVSCRREGISFWNLNRGEVVGRSVDSTFALSTVAVPLRGARALVTHHLQSPQLFDLTRPVPRSIAMNGAIPAEAAAFNASGTRFLIGNYYASQLWDADGSPIGSPLTHSGHSWPIALSDDGNWFVTCSHPCVVRLWRVEGPLSLGRFPAPERGQSPHSLIASRDGGRFASGAETGDGFRVRDARTGVPVGPELRAEAATLGGDFSADGKFLYAVGYDRRLRCWEVETGRERFAPVALDAEPRGVWVAPGGTLLCLLEDGGMELRDAETGALRSKANIGGRSTSSLTRRVAFSPDGQRFVTVGFGSEAKLWNLADLSLVRSFAQEQRQILDCVSFSPSGREVAVGGSGSTIVDVFDAETGRNLATLRHPDHLFALSFDPTGDRLLTACHDSRARLWDWHKAELAVPTMAHSGEVGDAVFSPDGRWIATADSRQARVWEASTGRPMTPWLPLMKPDEPPVYFANQLAFLGGGKLLLAALRSRHQTLFGLDYLQVPVQPTLSAEELIELSELNASVNLDVRRGVESMTGEEWLNRWRVFRSRHPEVGNGKWGVGSRE